MDAYESRILRELRDEVEQSIMDKMLAISAGSLEDSAYRFQCGIIRGMRDALDIAKEIEERINK